MRVRPVVLAVLALLVAGACDYGPARPEATVGRAPETVATTLPPVTTVAPTTTTTAEPDPATAKAVVTERGIVVPVVNPLGEGWVVRTPCHATANLSWSAGRHAGSPAIVLDPGHGGAEPGAVSPSGLAEAPVNLNVSRYTKAALEAEGVSVLLTRTGDYEVTLATRSEIARSVDPKAFVSIHHNAEPDGPRDGPGTETYYQIGSADSKRLAGLIYEEVVRALSQYKVAWVADTDAGAKYRPGRSGGDYYAMLRQPGKVVSVLVEGAFVSNPPEAELLARPEVQKVEGEAIARGIIRYLTTRDPGSGFVEPYPRVDPPSVPGTGPARRCRDPEL
ncbi:MAG: N-acetylmuramoyl-L-alanine amidase [Actinomycetota bacterium]|nr:N-acetylmuramoyl-L-alanine amidase [Actinomycetota bacterium]